MGKGAQRREGAGRRERSENGNVKTENGVETRERGAWRAGGARDTFLEQLVNDNGDPLPCFAKVADSKGILSWFGMNTFGSVDSAWFIGALHLDKSNRSE